MYVRLSDHKLTDFKQHLNISKTVFGGEYK